MSSIRVYGRGMKNIWFLFSFEEHQNALIFNSLLVLFIPNYVNAHFSFYEGSNLSWMEIGYMLMRTFSSQNSAIIMIFWNFHEQKRHIRWWRISEIVVEFFSQIRYTERNGIFQAIFHANYPKLNLELPIVEKVNFIEFATNDGTEYTRKPMNPYKRAWGKKVPSLLEHGI